MAGLVEVNLCPASGFFDCFEVRTLCSDVGVPSVLGKVLDFGPTDIPCPEAFRIWDIACVEPRKSRGGKVDNLW